jgi:iron complex outermembrane receptor protein
MAYSARFWAQELQQVIVIGNAPLPGFGLPLNQIPSNVQTANSSDIQREQTTDVADYLNNNFSGVNVSESAGNPFQLDIYYHGFTASPLLGTPEGLSVYVDGVRVNESFGDTVNWDLIPESAISTVSLISGSNPVFGLNTLGGALSLQTKSGHADPGTEFEAYGGSFGRRSSRVRPAANSAPSIISSPATTSMRPAGAMCPRRASGKASARLAGRPTARISI